MAAREQQESKQELARYRADYLAATAPLPQSLLAGALAGLGVYLVPITVVLGSFLALRLTYAATVPLAQLVVRLLRLGVHRTGRAAATPPAGPPPARPTEALMPPAIEPMLDQSGPAWVGAAALVLFWPLAMLAIGALAALLYRYRRARRLDELARTPLEFPILVEVVCFYALTAGAGLLVAIGTFVALGLNLIFAWAGYLIWRWLHDRLLLRLAPPAARAGAEHAMAQESSYRHQLRESG